MNWLFTIVPFCDFDAAAGPLYVAPGSHRTDRVRPGTGVCLEVEPAVKPQASDFVDPELKRGDLLLMSMHLWHRAADNRSSHHRVGLFNKYAAASAPPATGYYLYDDKVANALSEQGRTLLAVHSDRSILTTRAVLVRARANGMELFLQSMDGVWQLPGGATHHERAIPDWDLGNFIAPLQAHLRDQVAIELPWLSYVGDYPEAEGLCRVYGYTLNDHGFPVPFTGDWVPLETLHERAVAQTWMADAARQWLDPSVVRGKGLSQAQCRIDQFAY